MVTQMKAATKEWRGVITFEKCFENLVTKLDMGDKEDIGGKRPE